MATVIHIRSTGESFRVPATFTEAQVRDNYSADIPNLSSMVAEQTTDAEGNTVLTFSPRTGNKGRAA